MRNALLIVVLLGLPVMLPAQVARDGYYPYMPDMPKLVSQTGASERLGLYGDPALAGYADVDGDGIDDRRHARLAALADRFSPVLRRNNFSFPRDFRRLLGDTAKLQRDVWRAGQLVRSDEIPLGWDGPASYGLQLESGDALAALLRELDPLAPDARFTRADEYEETFYFVDFPGHDPGSWREAYRHADPAQATLYTHFFIHEDTAALDDRRYHLVAQHWFFYPFNDAANNHEGDWEHINVLITTRAAADADAHGRMSASELAALLDTPGSAAGGAGEAADDLCCGPLANALIAYVDYYFHESVVTLDYLAAYGVEAAATGSWLSRLTIWRDSSYLDRTVRMRVSAAAGRLATHPIGYIGGNNKGPDELLTLRPRFGGSYNRNGHGTYPFPGTWQSVGALGSTEQVAGNSVPDVSPGIASMPLRELVTDSAFVVFDPAHIVVVPDWERVQPLLRDRADTRRDWAWLVLPMRWGFPVSISPGGGAVAHTDVGNIAPEGPAFQPTWNRIGTATGWRAFDPEVLRVALAPTSPWDKMKNGWGLLNLPISVFGLLPGWNVVVTQLGPWISGTLHTLGSPPARTFSPAARRHRFSSMSAGPQSSFGGSEFGMLLTSDRDAAATLGSVRSPAERGELRQESAMAMRWGIELFYGPRLSIENTYARGRHALAATAPGFDDTPQRITGVVDTREVTGGFRYAVIDSERLPAFLRAGYGWTWYTVDDVRVNGAPSDYRTKGGYAVTLLPSRRWWPNTWYAGAGVEYLAPRGGLIFHQLQYGVRLDATVSRHRLGATRPGVANLGVVTRGDVTLAASVGW